MLKSLLFLLFSLSAFPEFSCSEVLTQLEKVLTDNEFHGGKIPWPKEMVRHKRRIEMS